MLARRTAFFRFWSVGLFLLGGAVGLAAGVSDPAGRLAYWRFDTPDWRDDQGRLPLAVSNASSAVSFDGRALSQPSDQGPGFVRFRAAEATGAPLLGQRQGSVRFLYHARSPATAQRDRPEAESTPTGPWRRLFEAGFRRAGSYVGRWMVSMDPTGTRLIVHTRDLQGGQRTNLEVRVEWPSPEVPSIAALKAGRAKADPNPWREIILNYSPSTCALVLDGDMRQDLITKGWSGAGFPPLNTDPSAEAAFCVGSSLNGEFTAEGRIDELETFAHPISPLRSYFYLGRSVPTAEIRTTPPAVKLSWFTTGNTRFSLSRVEVGSTNVVRLADALTGMSYTDTNNLKVGSLYRYTLNDRGFLISIQRAPVEDRGRVILLVDRTLAGALRSELERLHQDLAGDGWSVVRHDVARHRDGAWSGAAVDPAYRTDLDHIRSLVTADHQAAPDRTVAVLIIGHVTIPYSGAGSEDGHAEHSGAWPADSYYGDVQGGWTDTGPATPPSVTHPLLRNQPGDGKLDPGIFPRPTKPNATRRVAGLDMAVGRIDFARLPAFAPKSEADLLRQYLDKNHRFRHKRMTFQRCAVVGGYFGNPYHAESAVLYDTANVLAATLYPSVLSTVVDGNAFAMDESTIWAIQGGYGAPTALHNSPGMNAGLGIQRVSTADLARGQPAPKAAFYLLKGSYFGDWNFTDDNFLRAVLATPQQGLAALWTRHTVWALEITGVGDPLASAVILTGRGQQSVRTSSILGDPTLRLVVTAPPAGLQATRRSGAIELNWGASPDATQGYLVYRSTNGLTGPFVRLSPSAVAGTAFTDAAVPAGRLDYQVRACQLLTTGCGQFTNTSQGALAEVGPGR